MPHQSNPARGLRIVQVSPSYAPLVGGCERLLQGVSERLVERGHDVTVLTFDCATQLDFRSPRGAGLPPDEMLNGVRVIRVNPTARAFNSAHQWWLRRRGGWRTSMWLFGDELWPLEPPNGAGFLRPLARLEADVVTSANWCFGAAYWVCRPRGLRRTPRVAIPVLHIARDWANNPLYPRMLRNCDATIVCTDAERDFVQARGARAVAVGGAGVDPARFENRDGACIRARYAVGDRPVVGFVGRQDALKGVPTLIEAMGIVWRHLSDATLLIAGQTAHREPIVSRMLAELPADDRAKVILIDDFADADAPSIFDACDVLALPSVEESFGMVMIEAWMCGKPVIGADIAPTRCVVDDGIDGLIAKPFDAADLAEKILDLLSDPEKRASFGKRGRAKALERYTWDRVTDVWEATLQRAAARSPTATR
ncbi:MAG TPA: glycosyltransferase family 4 protein [Gemmatimonadaceae bacterium]|nr:glycosyltransferase family 4 protein [Gemmatimonadaceae bacterium]